MPNHKTRTEVIDDLVKFIDDFSPFLDSGGRTYCRLPHAEEASRPMVPIRDRQVRALLCFRYRVEHDGYPAKDRVSDAIEYVEGRLLKSRNGPSLSADCPVLRCFLVAAEEDGGSGSADEVLKLLKEVNNRHKVLKRKEKLPKSATAMGKWLIKNQLLLQAKGIEVFRPPRGSKKRLWEWRKIFPVDDADDTSLPLPSVSGGRCHSDNTGAMHFCFQNDPLLTELLATIHATKCRKAFGCGGHGQKARGAN